MTLDQFKHLPPPPKGQTGVTLDQVKSLKQGTPMFGNVGSDIQNAGNDITNAITGQGQYQGQNPLQRGLAAASTGAGAVVNTAADVIPYGKQALNIAGQGFNAATNAAGNINDTLNAGAVKAGIMSPAMRTADQQNATAFANSNIGQDVDSAANMGQSAGNIAGTILGAEGAATSGDAAINAVKNTANTLKGVNYVSNAVAPKASAPAPVDTAKITDLYNRAIKPSTRGQANVGQAAKATNQVVSGLKAIHDNKANLTFTTPDGETIAGGAPKTVEQLSSAINQTKTNLFKQYDALAKQAGEKGVTVDTAKVGDELNPIINSKSLQLANPSAVQYAKELQSRFNSAGELSATDAQDVIQHYNDALKAFYRNPSYDAASKAGIDAMIANKMRESLDKGISGATGSQYQQLKSQYGALSSMEKDVTHRGIVWGRQNKASLAGQIGNIASGAELARGLMQLNPTDLAISGVIKGIQKYHQYLNNPDVGVSRIFSELGRSSPPSTGGK